MADYLHKLFDLTGKKAVVIGATGVLGGQMAQALAQAGAHVLVAGNNQERGQARVQAIEDLGGKAAFASVDVTSCESIKALNDHAVETMGQVDVLINAAGVNSAMPYFEISDDEWDRLFAANMRGVHLACRHFGHPMVLRGSGSIINIASVSAFIPLSRVFAYSASKAAVVNYSQNLAREFGPAGVRVNCLSPGFFPAEQNRKILDEDRVNSIMTRTPMERFGEPHELDAMVVFLASDNASSFATGHNFVIDGGFSSTSI